MQSGLVNLFEYDKHLAASMGAGGENPLATNFAMNICKIYLIDDRSNAHIFESDLFTTIEALQKIATQSPRPPEGIANLMEMIKMSSERLEQNLAMAGPTAQLHSGIQQVSDMNSLFTALSLTRIFNGYDDLGELSKCVSSDLTQTTSDQFLQTLVFVCFLLAWWEVIEPV